MYEHFFNHFQDNQLVLTANRRLAHYLHRRYAHYQQSLGKVAWPTPHILPLELWIIQVWKNIRRQTTLLSPLQEFILWQQLSKQDRATITTLQQAWQNLIAWDIEITVLAGQAANEATLSFYQWATQFQSFCTEHHWISSAKLPAELLAADLSPYLPKALFLCGFDNLPPILTKLLTKIAADCPVSTLKTQNLEASSVEQIACEETETEIRQMAQWAYQLYQQNPHFSILCVVPHLTEIRSLVSRLILQTFHDDREAVNISSGQALSEFPIIQAALQLIQLLAGSLRDEEWESLLQSPYLAVTAIDQEVGALADARRRQQNLRHPTITAMLPILTVLQTQYPQSTLLKRWNALNNLQKQLPQQQTLNQWLDWFQMILHRLQWPGYQSLNSLEYQIYQRWQQALEEFLPCTDIINQSINLETALSLLSTHLTQIIFQGKTRETPVQVLGVLETAGIPCDALWVMGLSSERWPPAATPNPFLPYSLQIEANMPHASAHRELEFTQQTMQRLLASAPIIKLSYPCKEGDRECAPSPLIEMFPIKKNNTLSSTSLSLPIDKPTLEAVPDRYGPPLTTAEQIRGGTSILKSQALCPFQAFATIRLAATPLERTSIGLLPRQRGQLLHHALEWLWKQLKTQKTLNNLSDSTLHTFITTTLTQLLQDHYASTLPMHSQVFLPLEIIRLTRLLMNWLALEKQRESFTVIAQEKEYQVTIGTLKIPCRIDRIDRLKDGSELVIDYKSNLNTLYDWFTERPTQPQLPIYAVFCVEATHCQSLAFAEVSVPQFKGILSEKKALFLSSGFTKINKLKNPDDINNWQDLLDHWKTSLEKLSADFCQGIAEVNPKENACRYCKLQSFCRVSVCPA